MSLNQEIKQLLKQEGCNVVGFADLREFPVSSRKGFDFGIIMGEPYTAEGLKEYLEGNPDRLKNDSGATFGIFDKYKSAVGNLLKEKGYKSTDKFLTTQITHKMVGTISGIGWIGRCAILTTKEYGPALRLEVILTDAPIECGTPITKSSCPPDCNACADICPANAIKGGLWKLGVHRDEFFDVAACKKMRNSQNGFCGLCFSACPYAQKGLGYEKGDFDIKQFFIDNQKSRKTMKKITPFTTLNPCEIIDIPKENRKDVIKIVNPDSWDVVMYDLKKYEKQNVIIKFSANVKRVGASGELRWQINNPDYPAVGDGVLNADEDTWYSMEGEWTGFFTDSYPVLYLSSWNNNSNNTTYYIDDLRGEPSMHNFGESPNVAAVVTLSSILQANVPEKYYLTKRACEGILRRAASRGKQLPELLRLALEAQCLY